MPLDINTYVFFILNLSENFKKKNNSTNKTKTMKLKFNVSGLLKEVTFSLIIYQSMMSVGYGRSYVVFLFHQLDLPGSQIFLNDEQKSWIAGSVGIFSPLGCILSGTLMDMFGRKTYLFITFIPQIISWIVIALATSYDMLLYGMIIQGINLGMGYTASAYISEIASSNHRGALLGGLTIFLCMGATLCNTLMYFVSWKIVAWIYAGLSLFALLSTLALIESPVWLYNKGKKDAAIKALCSLRVLNVDDASVLKEIEDLEKVATNKQTGSFMSTIKSCLLAWKPFLITVILQLLSQLTGYTVLFGYTILMFDRLRLPIDSLDFTILYTSASLIGAMCCPIFLLSMNRRTHLSSTAAILAMGTIVVGVYEDIFYYSSEKPCSYIVPIAFYMFSWACTSGVLPIAYIVGTELYPSEVKGVLNGLFGAAYYITYSLILKLYPTLINIIDIKILIWSFTVFSVMVILFSTFILPETKGKTLNEIQEQYFPKKKKGVKSENA